MSSSKDKGKAKEVGKEDDDRTDHKPGSLCHFRNGSYLDKGKSESGEEGHQSVQGYEPRPSSGHGSYLERQKKNRPPAGPSRKAKGKAAGEDVYDLGPSSSFRGYIPKKEIGSPSKKCKFEEVSLSNTISGDDPNQSNQLVSGSGNSLDNLESPASQKLILCHLRDGSYLERQTKNRPPAGPLRKDKGKAEAGEEGYQTVQRNEPNPSSSFRGYIRKQEVGSPSKKAKLGEISDMICGDDPDQCKQLVLGCGLSARDVNPNKMVQYHDAHVTKIILDPIKMNPRLVARPKVEIHVWDIDKRRYNSRYGIRIVSLKSFASEDKHFALGLVHKNFTKILLYELEGSDVYMAHVWNPLSSLSSYCVEVPLKQYTTSHHPSSDYLYLSDSYRTFIRDIILSVVYLHKSDKSLGGFSIQNLIVVNDIGGHKIEFWGVLFYQSNCDRRKADFSSIAQVVKAIVPGWKTIFLIKDLVQKLEGYSSSTDSRLITQHLSLLSATEKICFIRNCVDKKPPYHYKWYSRYLKAVKGMGSNTGWTNKYILKPGKGPLYNCFSFGRGGYKDGCSYDSVQKNESILSFSRNMSAHLKQWIDADSSLQHPEVNNEHVSSTIFSEFEKQLTNFQEELIKYDILEKFSE